MNVLPYPPGDAKAIAIARANGQRPAGAVLIVMAGSFDDDSNPKVRPQSGVRYRWDWMRGLNAVVLLDAKTRLNGILNDIESAGPHQLDVIDHERRLGWLVNRTKPSVRATKWPRAWVEDWLGGGEWHRELSRLKNSANQKAAQQSIEPTFQPEPIWN